MKIPRSLRPLLAAATFLTLASPMRAAEPVLKLKDGDVWVMSGDSITAQRQHTNYIEAFYHTRHPALNLRFRNSGIGGNTTGSILQRFDYDIAAWKPTIVSVERAKTRLASLPILDGRHQIGTVVAALSDRPYDRTFNVALIGSLVLAGLLLGLVGLMSAAALRAALRPVSLMTADAADWSEHDLDKRFALGEPYDELTGLARTLDELLDRTAASLRRERLLTAEISHELRTPLAKITAQAELALRRERTPDDYRVALQSVVASAEEMNRTIETLLIAARQQTAGGGGSADVGAVLDRLTANVSVSGALGVSGAVRFDVRLPGDGLRMRVDPGVLERILAPILENAARYARTAITVTGASIGPDVVILVGDDGRGVPSGDEERIFEPGVSGAATDDERAGPGLGLALARRLARDAGGDVTATASADGGHFTLRLPSGVASR